MLKVLYLPIGNQPGMVDAFEAAGTKLEVFDFWGLWERTHSKGTVSSEFLTKVRNFQPNLIHMQLQFTGLIDASVIDEARRASPGVVITNWTGDVRADAQKPFLDVAHQVDLSLISSTGQLDLYRQAGCHNVRYWQIGYNPKVNYPMNLDLLKYDVSFLGNNYGHVFPDGNLRTGVADTLRSIFGPGFGLFGTGYHPHAPSVESMRANEIYNQSMCTLSISHFNSLSHYFSDRLLHCLASGRPTITWHFPGFESYFIEGKEIFIARSAKDVVDIVNYCKANPTIAAQVGMNGYQRVLKEHTFTSRVMELLHMTNLIHLV
jgi:spore maturation protein CgeB